jgi:hypothetical protein
MKAIWCIASITAILSFPHLSFAEISIEGKLTHEYEVETGATYTGKVVIKNIGAEPEDVMVYQNDFASTADGARHYQDPNTTQRSNASWLTISPRRFRIPAEGTHVAHFTIKVPNDKTLEGTYWSILMVESIPKESPESPDFDPDKVTLGIRTRLRYAIRMITHIEDTGSVHPQIIGSRLAAQDEKRYLQVDVENTGTLLLRVLVYSELYTQEGEYVGKYSGQRLAVFPGSSIRFQVDLTEVPKNKYRALVVMDCGNNDFFGTSYTLILPE